MLFCAFITKSFSPGSSRSFGHDLMNIRRSGGRDTKQRGEDEAVVSADLQTNEHASERDGQPADLSDILRYIEDARSFISLFRLGVREKKGGMRVSEARGLSVCVCVAGAVAASGWERRVGKCRGGAGCG